MPTVAAKKTSSFWIYKCNSKGHEHQRAYGDWAKVFEGQGARSWGSTKIVPELAEARVGDTILAYQTNRNELVGVTRVVAFKQQGRFKSLILEPVQVIRVRVRPLKKANPRVAQIRALQPGPIRTLYTISRTDASTLLRAAGTRLVLDADVSERNSQPAMKGAGFGTTEQNKLVELAAVRHVVRDYESQGWSVRDVSAENRGYDLICRRSSEEVHVEVKGATGEGQQFILTAKELNAWTKDNRFVLAFVGRACSAKPALSQFRCAESQVEFSIRPLSFIAKRQPAMTPTAASRKQRQST